MEREEWAGKINRGGNLGKRISPTCEILNIPLKEGDVTTMSDRKEK